MQVSIMNLWAFVWVWTSGSSSKQGGMVAAGGLFAAPTPQKKKIYHQPPPVLTISLQQVYVNAKRTKQLLEQPQKKTEATQTPYSF